ncbi:MAG: hypothetical protein WBC05_10085 [Sedimentisphaerales bacterium]
MLSTALKQLYQARYQGSRSSFEVKLRKALTDKTASLKQQKLALNTNNEFKAACEYPVHAGEIVNSIVITNREWSSTNHFHIFVPLKVVIRLA